MLVLIAAAAVAYQPGPGIVGRSVYSPTQQ